MLLVVFLLGAGACEPGAARQVEEAASRPAAVPPHKALMLSWVGQARAATSTLNKAMATAAPAREPYLALRRNVAAAAPFLRGPAPLGSEVLLGPPESGDEAGGALQQLDAAQASASTADEARALEQLGRALEVIHGELSLNGVPPEAATAALSDACFELGLMLLEANPTVPDGADAVRADLLGRLDGIDAMADATAKLAGTALGADAAAANARLKQPSTALRAAVTAVEHSHQLKNRAELVQLSGQLGRAARELATAVHVRTRLPYRLLRAEPAAAPQSGDRSAAIVTPLLLPEPARPAEPAEQRSARIALGRRLFYDRRLSRGDTRACADCHQPDKGMSDGLAAAASLIKDAPITRNTPTLLYAPLNAAQLWDGRFASATRQAQRVLHAPSEMGLTTQALASKVRAIADYQSELSNAGDDDALMQILGRALDAFQQHTMLPAASPFDRYARGDKAALSPAQLAGLDVLAGVGRCTRCHIPPTFAGSRPAGFNTPIFANLGMLDKPSGTRLDSDVGRAAVTHNPVDSGMFKTPTLRNLTKTGPYFHHGRFTTLEQVVDFYDKGGGRGSGVAAPGQDPDVRPLKLSAAQREALLLFLRTALIDPDTSIQSSLGARPAPQ